VQHHVQPLCRRRRRAWPGRQCSQSGNTIIHVSLSSLQLPHCALCTQAPLDLPPQCTTGCWCCDISHPPRHVACITVKLVTVSKCPVSPSLYSRWLRPEPTQSDHDQACTWSQVIAMYSRRSNTDRGKPYRIGLGQTTVEDAGAGASKSCWV